MTNKNMAYLRYKRFRETYAGISIILSTYASVGWTNSKKDYYLNLGYKERKQGEVFSVPVSDLPFSSAAKIDVQCPVCHIVYISSLSRINNKNGTTVCHDCSGRYDLSGQEFGRLIAISPIAGDLDNGTRSRWLCQCECGEYGEVRTDQLTNGWTQSCGCIHMEYLKARTGENHPRWIKWEDRVPNRNPSDRASWKALIHKRDGYKCVSCECRDLHLLNAHHLNCYSKFPDEATDIDNGITLCQECHYDFHITFMGGYIKPCTKSDFRKWIWQKGIDCNKIKCKIQ